MTTQTTTPFTYYVAWTNLDKHYYGVKYAIGCNPSDLWTTYFTSSKLVEQYRLEYSEPDIIEVRKTFDNSLDAVTWEKNVLTKLNVVNNDRWLNQVISGLWDLSHEQRSEIISNAVTEWHSEMSTEQKELRNKKLSESRKRYIANRTPEQKARDYEVRLVGASKSGEAISKAAKERWNDPVWVKNETQRRNETGHLDNFKAACRSQETLAKIRATQQTQEYRDKISTANKKRFENDDHRKQVSDTMKAHCSSDAVRKQMSENAKKSTGNRLATRYMNKISDSELTTMHIDDIIEHVTAQVKQEFDIDKLISKIEKRKLSLT